jgi:hypothetical protein
MCENAASYKMHLTYLQSGIIIIKTFAQQNAANRLFAAKMMVLYK